jgi:hypothetical protein
MTVHVERIGGILHAVCMECAAATSQPDKGIGRANLAAWKTRHQHTQPTTDHGGQAAGMEQA